jgi:biotin carboxyl carrier protein
MRSFRVRVSGKTYLVEVDDLSKSPIQVVVNGRPFNVEVEWQGAASEATVRPEIVPASPAREAVMPAGQRPAQPPTPRISESERAGAATVDAPMPGTIVEVRVKPGDAVSRGDELCLLEAMKMRNSIRSPRDGEIEAVLVAAGAKVAYGDALVRFAGPAN